MRGAQVLLDLELVEHNLIDAAFLGLHPAS